MAEHKVGGRKNAVLLAVIRCRPSALMILQEREIAGVDFAQLAKVAQLEKLAKVVRTPSGNLVNLWEHESELLTFSAQRREYG